MGKVRVELFDERLTSKGADALEGTKKTKAAQDAIAAMLTLQNFFDKVDIQWLIVNAQLSIIKIKYSPQTVGIFKSYRGTKLINNEESTFISNWFN